jgi:uncharacterized phage protein (TIGR01671 family)
MGGSSMREYKFMVWDKRNKRMDEIDGINLYLANGRIYELYAGSFGYETTFEKKDVTENYELMQYTGHKDKNDKEIYEGDICKCIDCNGDEYTSKIEVDGGAFCIEVNNDDYDYTAIGWALKNDIQEIEVIGNIYENGDQV